MQGIIYQRTYEQTGKKRVFKTTESQTKTKNMAQGDFIQMYAGELNLCAFKDRTIMYLMNNCCDPDKFVQIHKEKEPVQEVLAFHVWKRHAGNV